MIVTDELTTRIDGRNEVQFSSAGGQTVNNYASTRLELTRLVNHKFAAKLLKSSTTPEIIATFEVRRVKIYSTCINIITISCARDRDFEVIQPYFQVTEGGIRNVSDYKSD